MTVTIAPGPAIPATDFPSSMAGLAMIGSPAKLASAAESSRGAPATELPPPEAEARPSSAVYRAVKEGEMDDKLDPCEPQIEGAGAGAVLPVECLGIGLVAIKPEV